ncbi:MAG: histidine phosphatase family protein [Lachnospiraceae bacterium]|jgi:probable phosphoglycerate mutase|nr:histidine phosphatase family protein [Lachnospiraceae bacterium]
MKLVFVRHGDPDYVHDSLTAKGRVEAEILSGRIAGMKVRDFYCSPLGRAQETAAYSLEKIGRTAVTKEWLREFPGYVIDSQTGKRRIPWDFMPRDWTACRGLYDKEAWLLEPVMKSGDVAEVYGRVCDGIDGLLEDYGYVREGSMYRTQGGNTDTLVFFCHLGITFAIMAHLIGLSPVMLWQGFFVAPTSVTTLVSEERIPGEVFFRCVGLGDISHLYQAGEEASKSGFFEEMR